MARGKLSFRARAMTALAGLLGVTVETPGRRLRPGAYDGGRLTRRDPDWLPRGLGPNAEAELGDGGLVRVQKRGRDLAANNALIAGAIETICENVVGVGYTIESDTGFDDLNEQINRARRKYGQRLDPERCMNQEELLDLFVSELETVGEVGVRQVIAPAFKRFPAGPAIELIEAERLPIYMSGRIPRADGKGNIVRQGVEYDEMGRVVAYHVMTSHPSDGGVFGGAGYGFGINEMAVAPVIGSPGIERIPVEQMAWCFRSARIAQLRGVPRSASVMTTVRTEATFQEDSLMLAKTATAFGAIMEMTGNSDIFEQDDGTQALMVDATGAPVMRIESGSMGFVPPGTKVSFSSPNLPGPMFEQTKAVLNRDMSRGLRVSYANLTGDSSRSNFSSSRGDSLAEQKSMRKRQRFTWTHGLSEFDRAVINYAILRGEVALTAEHRKALAVEPEILYHVSIGYPGWTYVNPAQDATATATDIESGVGSEIEAISEKGRPWRQVARERVQYAAFLKAEMEAAGLEPEDLLISAGGGKGGAGSGAADAADGTDAADGAGGKGKGNGAGNGQQADARIARRHRRMETLARLAAVEAAEQAVQQRGQG